MRRSARIITHQPDSSEEYELHNLANAVGAYFEKPYQFRGDTWSIYRHTILNPVLKLRSAKMRRLKVVLFDMSVTKGKFDGKNRIEFPGN